MEVTHEALVRRFYQALDDGNADLISEIFTSDSIDHDTQITDQSAVDSHLALVAMLRVGFSQPAHELTKIGELDEETIFVRWQMTGQHTGEFLGVSATHRHVLFHGHDVFRISQGKIAEVWHIEQLLQLMGQLTAEK